MACRLIRTLVILTLVWVVSGCSGRHKVDLRLLCRGDQAGQAGIRDAVRVFEQHQHGDIRIEIETLEPGENLVERLLKDYAAGRMPDVFLLNSRDVPRLLSKGVLYDLTGKSPELIDFQPRLVESFFADHRLWAVPSACSPIVLYYNKKKFDRIGLPYPTGGWDWTDLRLAAERLTLKDPEGQKVIQYGIDLSADVRCWIPFIWQNGGEVADLESGRWVIGKPANIQRNAEALQYYTDLIHRSHAAQARSPQAASQPEDYSFDRQLSAMVLAGREYGAMLELAGRVDWDVAPLPKNRVRSTLMDVEGYAISKFSAHPEAAWLLVRHLTGPTAQTRLGMSGELVPARVSAGQSKVFLDFPGVIPKNNRAFLDSLYYARPLPVSSHWPEIRRIIAAESDLLFTTGTDEARDSLIRIQSKIDELEGPGPDSRLKMPPQRKAVDQKKN